MSRWVLGYCGIDGSREFSADFGWPVYFGHDAAAVLLCDGEVVAAAEEERFTREKHTPAFPCRAIEYCLAEAGLRVEQLDHVAYNWKHSLATWLQLAATGLRDLPVGKLPRALRLAMALERRLFRRSKVRADFARLTGWVPPPSRFHFVEHHMAHAASAYFGSTFPEAAVLTVDGIGEVASGIIGIARGTTIAALDRVRGTISIGMLYMSLTDYLGFAPESDEYKVMGMAAYGDPAVFRPVFNDLIVLRENGHYAVRLPGTAVIDRPHFQRSLEALFGPRRAPQGSVEQHHCDVAAALQEATERVILHQVEHAQRVTGARTLCLAGGVALNCKANGRIASSGLFEDVYVPPVAGDNGGALGAAWLVHHRLPAAVRNGGLKDAYTGPAYGRDVIVRALEARRAELTAVEMAWEPLLAETVARLARGEIVAWFQGRMEFGPRALGNRSILADPRQACMKDHVNARIKHREPFRPFAPAVPEERAHEYFEFTRITRSPYMLFVLEVRAERRHVIPAVTHVDGTARVQTVSARENARFHALLSAFGAATGVPVVLNTSFNVQGEPIVCTPEDALGCFLGTEIDALILGDFLVGKRAP